MLRKSVASLGLCLLVSAFAAAQAPSTAAPVTGSMIDQYFGDWHNAPERTTHGSLHERDIFTPGNAANPPKKSAVLRHLESYTYATLAPGASTTPTRLASAQEVYYFVGGSGSITAGGASHSVARNIAVLVPANLEYTLKSTGSTPLQAYLVREPIPAGFRPNADLLIRDENSIPITSTDGLWVHIVKTLFTTADGLGTLESVLVVAIDPLTMGKPHVHNVDLDETEEIWQSLSGTSLAFVGNRLIRQTPGMAFYHIPIGKTPHTNINYSQTEQDRFLYIARYHDHEDRK